MTQIVNKRTRDSVPLSTLAQGAALVLDDTYDGLSHKAFLFEYRMTGSISSALIADWLAEGGIKIVLIKQGVTDAEVILILDGAEITDSEAHDTVPFRQQLFAIAWVKLLVITSATDGTFEFELMFKPKSKGGIPFSEGSGWEVKIFNNSGGTLTTGNNIANINIYERFAYEGGGL